jgi:hypothetical protein
MQHLLPLGIPARKGFAVPGTETVTVVCADAAIAIPRHSTPAAHIELNVVYFI